MNELKTLKDLNEAGCENCLGRGSDAVWREELKQEAIKIVKEFEKRPSGVPEIKIKVTKMGVDWINRNSTLKLNWDVIDFIKWFYNITEEELK